MAVVTTVAAGMSPTPSIARARLRALLLPLVFAVTLALIALVAPARDNARLMASILGAAAILLLATAVTALRARAQGRRLSVERALRAQHYVQACAQSTVLIYWGWAWRPVYEAVPLIAAQLVFAYAFDMLLTWSRRDTYTLGFGPFPVIFSINLFLWFKPDWFYLQFLMVAVGFAAKELIRWNRDGKRVHIFNPSSFPLAVFSVFLILTGTTAWTWGPEIAVTQFNPPNIYLLLFLVGLPGQLLFGVTTMTMSAVLTTYLFGVAYFAATGSYFFIDSYIPVAVFLGMHLLFTDPSTAPRSEIGRIIFGILYGLGNIALYELLSRAGVPTFYDKLLPVPIMNLSVQLIDRLSRSRWLQAVDPARLAPSLTGKRRHLAYVIVWSATFAALSASDGVGDNHPGHRVPFWQAACQQDARGGCVTLATILDTYCDDGSGWACNEAGALRWHGRVALRSDGRSDEFIRGCVLGFPAACQNVARAQIGSGGEQPPFQSRPLLSDYPVILRTGKGALDDTTPAALLNRACDQGFGAGCDDLGALHLKGDGVPRDPARAAAAYVRACDQGIAAACSNVGLIYYSGDGVPKDEEVGVGYLKRACDLGFSNGCRWLEELPGRKTE